MTDQTKLVSIVRLSSIDLGDKFLSSFDYTNLETYSILWIDPFIFDTKDFQEICQRLRTSINYIKIFKTIDEGERYLELIPTDDRIFLIINQQLGQEFVPRIHQRRQIYSIYIYDQKRHGHWAKELNKVKTITTQIDVLINQIKSDRIRRNGTKIDEPMTLNFFHRNFDSQINDRFIRRHFLIDCLLNLKEISPDRKKFIEICEEQYKSNKTELNVIKEFEENYASTRSIRWLTRQAFLSRIFHKALRLPNVDLLFLLRFFIDDLQQQIIKNQSKQFQNLFRAIFIGDDQFEILKNSLGGFLMFNSFLLTNVDRQIALNSFDQVDQSDQSQMKRVLFEIEADPRLENVKPFGNIIWLSYCFGQQEVLMMLGSIFRIELIQEEDKLTIVKLILCSELDADLNETFDHLRKIYQIKDLNLLTFGHVLSDMKSFDDAKQFYLRLLKDLPEGHQDLATCYHALANVAVDKEDFNLSLQWYEKLFQLLNQTLNSDDVRLADTQIIIGNIYSKKNDLKLALESYTKALTIYKLTLDENHLILAECLEKIAGVYEREKKFFQALNSYEKALNIRQKSLPAENLDLALIHSKIATVRLSLCHYFLALGHFNIALKIKLNLLPSDHVDIAFDYRGMGHIYKSRGEFNQALIYYEKAMEIYRHHLPAEHPDLMEIDRVIRSLLPQTK